MIQVNLNKYAPDLPEVYVMAVVSSADAVWNIVPQVSCKGNSREVVSI
jgi:hypothetical protein